MLISIINSEKLFLNVNVVFSQTKDYNAMTLVQILLQFNKYHLPKKCGWISCREKSFLNFKMAHPPSYPVGTGNFFNSLNRPGQGSWLLSSNS
jgi:hypothetical protein